MTLLDNEKVREYFQEEKDRIFLRWRTKEEMALAVIQAMQQPIKCGERYLNTASAVISEGIATSDWPDYFHYGALRLPDRYQPVHEDVQKKECESHWCNGCGGYLPHKNDPGQPKPAPEPSSQAQKCGCLCHPLGKNTSCETCDLCQPASDAPLAREALKTGIRFSVSVAGEYIVRINAFGRLILERIR